MNAPNPFRTPSVGQLVAVLAATIALFFMISFGGKALQAHRLRSLKERLTSEQQRLIRQRDDLKLEVERRQSDAWAAELLRDAGWVPPGGVRVIPITATPDPASKPTPLAAPTTEPRPRSGLATFASPQWRAWIRLIWGFD